MPSDRHPSATYKDLMKPDEDWTAMPNNAERRKVQNRIAQRAYRRNMRERTNEVEVLKRKIRELEGNTRSETALDPSCNLVPSSTSAEPPGGRCRDPAANGNKGDVDVDVDPSIRDKNEIWPYLPATEDLGELSLQSPDRGQTDLDLINLECFSDFARSDIVPFAAHPGLPQSPQHSSRPEQSARTYGRVVNPVIGQQSVIREIRPTSSRVDHATSPLARRPTLSAGVNTQPPQGLTTSTDVGDLCLWPGAEPRLPSKSSDSSSSLGPNVKPDPGEDSASSVQGRSKLLHLAIASGSADTVRILLQHPGIPTNRKDSAGYTPLQRAIIRGRADLVALLLNHGVNVASDDDCSENSLDAELENT